MNWNLYYLLDLTGPDGRPSHTKIAAMASWLFGLAWTCFFILDDAPYTFILAWTSLSFVAPYGLKGLIEWFRRDRGESPDVAAEALQIQARRAVVDDDFEPTR